MPAILDDPTRPAVYRTSGPPPYPTPGNPQLPPSIAPRQVTLRDHITIATLIPFPGPDLVPHSLLAYLCDQLNREIEIGDTYPMISAIPLTSFGPYWFQNFGAVMLLGKLDSADSVFALERKGTNWKDICLGSFYIKPNYPGRSSHVCNGGFLVTDAARNRGVGRQMGEAYLEWAPKLGYTYSVFNLVYETNTASCKIWDALGFKRIGRVPKCGNLGSYPDKLIDAIIYGRDLGPEGEDFVSEERFDKIRFYLKHQKYPNGADRAEKSRLRSAATHYKLLPAEDGSDNERLMLKDKEVVSDPHRQYEIARQEHTHQHSGINKTTATIAEKYHWVRIKETVSLVIKNCAECKENNKVPTFIPDVPISKSKVDDRSAAERIGRFNQPSPQPPHPEIQAFGLPTPLDTFHNIQGQEQMSTPQLQNAHVQMHHPSHDYGDMPVDPQLMDSMVSHRNPGFQSPSEGFSLDIDHQMRDGTRLATNEHVQHHDQPMTYPNDHGN